MSYDEMAADLARLGELNARAAGLWDAERDEDGEVIPWGDAGDDVPHIVAAGGRP